MNHHDIKDAAMDLLEHAGLENVTDSAYALNPEFTPNYSALALELGGLVGYQLRLTAAGHQIVLLPYDTTTEQVEQATMATLRKLMTNVRAQAQDWLDKHPE